MLSLFSEVAEERALPCVVDDAQWLDQASALTLAFVARRLLAEPVGIVFAAREAGEVLGHVFELEVRGLVNADARALLTSVVPFELDGRVRNRIIAETRGNPLALREPTRDPQPHDPALPELLRDLRHGGDRAPHADRRHAAAGHTDGRAEWQASPCEEES